ncbi:hypothetical protein KRP22_001324 [Phytophthora ramorum]|nr:hypothetical protein KRP22_7267 [Phytophthora ramorum]
METSAEYSEETKDSRAEGTLESSNSTEDRLQSAQEQLVELQLLARADLQSPASSFTIPSVEIAETSSLQDEEVAARDRLQPTAGGLSSFSAILAASKKLAATSTDLAYMNAPLGNDPALGMAAPVLPLDQARQSLTVEIFGRCSSPKSSGKALPTLSEETEGGEDEEEEDMRTPETVFVSTAPTLADKLSRSHTEKLPVRQGQELDEPDIDDDEFIEMLEHLSRGKIDFLALTAEDLAVRKLKRVQAALRRSQTATPAMPFVRALVSVDMLRLLLLRLGVQTVRDAVYRAIRQIGEREETADPVALMTSSNIAAIVLEVRRDLTAESSVASPPPRRTTAATSTKHHVRRSSNMSPRPSSSPSSSVSCSPRCGTPRSPAADRRSILAKEGAHVLMQEKIVSFDHRGQANALPAFRVRGASATFTDSAAKRRQRGLQYANDHVTHRTVHM